VVQLTSGSKPEFGPGGFETYANLPGSYQVQFMDQQFEISSGGHQFTKVLFSPITEPATLAAELHLSQARSSYAVGEDVGVKMAVTNQSRDPVSFGILGILTNTGHFQTSWDNGLIQPGQTFRHQDSLTFDRPGRYTLQLSICLARRQDCLGTDQNWIRFEPALELVVQ
jgi:hypothetical protein